MVDTWITKKKQEVSFRTIVLGQLQDILKISQIEFHGGDHTKIVYHGDWSEKVKTPDQRKCYNQSVLALYDLLFPKFDDKAKRESDTIMNKLNGLLKKSDDGNIKDDLYEREKIKLMRKLFRSMSVFLNKIKYLETKVIEEDE